jgi:chromosome segregation ATPase
MAANPEKIVVTREMVFEAADRLKAGGVDPTNRKLLGELGGSMTTIATFLRDWRAHQSIAVPSKVEAVDVPAVVLDAGNQALSAIWQVCQAEQQRKVEQVTEEANARVKETEIDRDRVLTELADSDGELKAERARFAEATANLDRLRVEHIAMQTYNEQLVNEAQQTKAVAEEISRRADELAESFKHERDRADKLAEELAALQPVAQRVAAVESENVGLRAEVERLRQSVAQEREQREALARTERAQAAELAQALARVAGLAEQLEDVKKRSAEQIDELKQRGAGEILRLQEQVQRAEQDRDAARQELASAGTTSGKLAGQVEVLQQQVSEQAATLRAFSPKTEAPRGAGKGRVDGGDGKAPNR